MQERDIHKGHRERMIEKALRGVDNLDDHELLEILLYPVVPRKDVNPLAHGLLNRFGSLSAIFNASAENLASIKGVGDKTAAQLLIYGRILLRIRENEKKESTALKKWDKQKDNEKELLSLFDGITEERFIILLLDKKFRLLNKMVFDGNYTDRINADSNELIDSIALLKPSYMIVSHNHPSGNLSPSRQDDLTTAKLNFICVAHNVDLLEHIIVGGGKTYSYRNDDKHRLEVIKNNCDLGKIYNNLRENITYDD